MTPRTWRQLRTLIEGALGQSPATRGEWLERACAGDPDRRREVESFLRAHDELSPLLERPVFSLLDPPPARAGPYRLVRELGRGGMGRIYLAERDDRQFRRRAAVKILSRELARPDLLERFHAERQILARLEHPAIAHLYDGGTTEEGLPYLVMEYVEGDPIDVYCDAHRLTVAERIGLFREVCSAVHYAHQNLVVHRDIKPSNILVSAEGAPKLLDFGIAKLLEPRGDPTATGMRMMTPGYASPEQVRGEPITTGSDVFSLGVLLNKLLTGRLPYRHESGLPHELDRLFRETEPVRPSQAIAPPRRERGEDQPRLAALCAARRTQPAQLRRALAGDLDAIVLTALRVEAHRRYPSAQALAEDLRRHGAGFPVLARGDTLAYRAGKFVRRHRLTAVIAAAVLLLVLGFALMATLHSARLEREHRQTEQVAEFLVALFDTSAAGSARNRDITARELLERGEGEARDGLTDQPEVRATLLDTIGRAYHNLGLFDRAVPLIREALALRRRVLGEAHPRVGDSLHHLGAALLESGQVEESEGTFGDALALRRRVRDESLEVAETLNALAVLHRLRGAYDHSLELARHALELREGLAGEESEVTVESRLELAASLIARGDYPPAEPLLERSIASLRRFHGGDRPDLYQALSNLGVLHLTLGDLSAAEPLIVEAVDMQRRLLGEDHPDLAESLSALAFLRHERADYEGAAALLRESLELTRDRLGPTHPRVARDLFNLAQTLSQLGQSAAAERLFRDALSVALQSVGEEHHRVANLRASLARVVHRQGRLEESEDLYRQAVATLERQVGEGHPDLATAQVGLGRLLVDRGEYEEAEELLRAARDRLDEALGAAHPRTLEGGIELGACLLRRGRPAEAEPLIVEGLRALEARGRADDPDLHRARALERLLRNERAAS